MGRVGSGSGQRLGPISQCKRISHLRESCREQGLVGVALPASHRRWDVPAFRTFLLPAPSFATEEALIWAWVASWWSLQPSSFSCVTSQTLS